MYGDAELIDHILIHCPFVVDVWNAMLHEFGLCWVFSSSMITLLSIWRSSAFNAKGKRIWCMVPVAVW